MTVYDPETSTVGPGPDFRANAFVGAWDRIQAAQKLKVDRKNNPVEQLPELYWSLMLEAAVFAHLANADEDPGRDAGAHLTDRAEKIYADREQQMRKFLDSVNANQGEF